jgi:hypothetical protein
MNSDFPLQVGFPIFIANVLDFVGAVAQSGEIVTQTGRSMTYRTTQALKLESPNRPSINLEPTDGLVTVSGLPDAGEYKLGDQRLTVNLRSDTESDIAPKTDISFGQATVKATQTPYRLADFWRMLALLALAVLAFEWWFYARKS